MEEQRKIIQEYLEGKGIDYKVLDDEICFDYNMTGKISLCSIRMKLQEKYMEIIARLPLHIDASEYGHMLYALMGFNRSLARGGFELEPVTDVIRFRVCIMPKEGETLIDAERIMKAVAYCEENIREWETELLCLLSNRAMFMERDCREVFSEKAEDPYEEYEDIEDDYDDKLEGSFLLHRLKKLLGIGDGM